jgi:hypothetical protein
MNSLNNFRTGIANGTIKVGEELNADYKTAIIK